MITRPVLRYPGGKWKLARWVIEHFPAHQTYVELYGGAASVLMRKSRSVGEVYNDLNKEVVNVFQVLRDQEQARELCRLLKLTPYARIEYDMAYEYCEEPIEKARRMIFRSFAGHGSDSVNRPHAGFRGTRNLDNGVTAAQEWTNYPDEIQKFTERLQGVCIENLPALKLLPVFDRPDTLFYVDPPYLKSTCNSSSVKYTFEMTDADHEELATALHQVKGMVILSGYPSRLYDRLYADWRCVSHSHRAQNNKATTECLWLSPNILTTMF